MLPRIRPHSSWTRHWTRILLDLVRHDEVVDNLVIRRAARACVSLGKLVIEALRPITSVLVVTGTYTTVHDRERGSDRIRHRDHKTQKS